MHYSLLVRCIEEFIGTAIMVALGNGSVANVELKGTKGYHGGWVLIGFGYGIGVMIPALMFATVSGAQINPAMTLAMAVTGNFPWGEVAPYIVAQVLGPSLVNSLWYWLTSLTTTKQPTQKPSWEPFPRLMPLTAS